MSFEVLNQNWSFKFNERRIRAAFLHRLRNSRLFLVNFAKMCWEATGAEVSRHMDYKDKWITDDSAWCRNLIGNLQTKLDVCQPMKFSNKLNIAC